MIIYTAINGHLDDIPLEKVAKFEEEFFRYLDQYHGDIGRVIAETADLDEDTDQALRQAIGAFKEQFIG